MRRPAFALLCVLALGLAACGGDDAPEEEGGLFSTLEQANNLREAAGEMQERLEEVAERGPAETIDFRRLRDLLPETAAGLTRTGQEGSKNGASGFTISTAEGTYAADSSADAGPTLTVSDLGGTGMAVMMAAAWTMAEIDQETDTSFERTTEISGSPGYEKFDTESGRGEVQVLIVDRFLVKASGSAASVDVLRDLVQSVDMDQLADWRDEGRPTE